MQLSLHRGAYQGPPTVVARLEGTVVTSTHEPGRTTVAGRSPEGFIRTLRLALERGRYRIVRSEGGVSLAATPARVAGRALAGSEAGALLAPARRHHFRSRVPRALGVFDRNGYSRAGGQDLDTLRTRAGGATPPCSPHGS